MNSIAVGFNIAIALPLFAWLDVPGLALAHTISYVFAAILGGVVLRRQLGGLDEGRIGSSALRITFASAASAAVAWLVAKGVAEVVDTGALAGQILQVGGAVIAALILYAALAALLRLDEFRPLMRMVTGRFARRADA